MTLTIDILYTADDNDWQELARLVREALDALGLEADLRYHEVKSDREAFELNFIGSPTVRIDGSDPWPIPNAPAGLRLRPYFSAEGMVDYPTYPMLVEALKMHVEVD